MIDSESRKIRKNKIRAFLRVPNECMSLNPTFAADFLEILCKRSALHPGIS